HVFNYDVPSHAEDYVHCIGRSGRAGREGKALMICVPQDEKNLGDIETLIAKPIPRIESTYEAAPPPRTRERRESQQADEAPAANDAKPPRNDEDRSRRSRGGRNRRRDRDYDDGGVVGMGDHLPSFIALSFEERRAS
ncbi:MAG: DEAD/DEAH box helicase, partial [Rhodobacteraceae bacterium]|nr:DEAD/DEAH box helicase [Paracoccaceae bacterium]